MFYRCHEFLPTRHSDAYRDAPLRYDPTKKKFCIAPDYVLESPENSNVPLSENEYFQGRDLNYFYSSFNTELTAHEHLLLGIHLLSYLETYKNKSDDVTATFILNDAINALQVAIDADIHLAHFFMAAALSWSIGSLTTISDKAKEHFLMATEAKNSPQDIIDFYDKHIPLLKYQNNVLLTFKQVLAEIDSYPYLNNVELELLIISNDIMAKDYLRALTYRHMSHKKPANQYTILSACYENEAAKEYLKTAHPDLISFIDILKLDLKFYSIAEQAKFMKCFITFYNIYLNLRKEHYLNEKRSLNYTGIQDSHFVYMWDLSRIANNKTVSNNVALQNHILQSNEDHNLTKRYYDFVKARMTLLNLVTDKEFPIFSQAASSFYQFLVMQANNGEDLNFARVLLDNMPKPDQVEKPISKEFESVIVENISEIPKEKEDETVFFGFFGSEKKRGSPRLEAIFSEIEGPEDNDSDDEENLKL